MKKNTNFLRKDSSTLIRSFERTISGEKCSTINQDNLTRLTVNPPSSENIQSTMAFYRENIECRAQIENRIL